MKHLFLSILFLFMVTSLSVLAQTGDIQGTVYQRSTGKPLATADVHLLETDQREKTDENGNFRFRELPEGTYTLEITHPVSPKSTEISVEISSGDTIHVKVYLGAAFKLEKILVEGKRLPPTVSRKDIRGSELLRIPGTGRDALKGLTTLPSIGIPNDIFGVLYIRGSNPADTLYYLDRTPLGYPFHYGGLVSTINSDIIEDIHIYAGGYGAEFGLDSQTVLDILSRDRLDKQRLHGKFNLNVLYSEGMLEGRIGNKGYVHAAGRRSYLDLIAGLFVDEGVWPYFSDYQFKFAYELAGKHHLMLNAFGAIDHFDILPNDEDAENFSAYFKNGFEAQGIHLRSQFSDKLTSHLSLTRALNFLNIDFREVVSQTFSVEPDGERVLTSEEYAHFNVRVNVPVYTLREDIAYKLTPKLQFEPGFLFTFSPANSFEDTRFPTYERANGPEVIPTLDEDEELLAYNDGTYEVHRFETNHDEFGYDFQRAEGYLQGRYDPLAFLSLALGVRFDYLNLTEEFSVQPRGSLSLKLLNGSTLRFAYGAYAQSPFAYQVLAENGNRALKSSLAQHYIMEFEHELSSQTELKFAVYYKNLQDLVTTDEIEPAYFNQGAGYIGGAEAFLRHRVNEKFFGWFSYAWTHQARRTHPDAPYKPYIFDNTHILSVVYNYNITPTFEIGARGQYLSGTSSVSIAEILLIQDPVTRGMHPLLNNLQGEDVPLASLPAYHRLDVRVSKTFNINGWQIDGFLEILNVYNKKNTIKFFNPEDNDTEEAPQFPTIPYIGLTLEF